MYNFAHLPSLCSKYARNTFGSLDISFRLLGIDVRKCYLCSCILFGIFRNIVSHEPMKPISSVIIFLLLVCSSVWASVDSYYCAETAIVQDMNQALSKTLAQKREAWITPDTIQSYRQHLQIADLKNCSFVSYALGEDRHSLCSRQMKWASGSHSLTFQSYADCSFATVWGLSDQRLPLAFLLLAMVWMAVSVVYIRRHRAGRFVLGRMVYATSDHSFRDWHGEKIAFTPMQQQLMELFINATDHKLSKVVICETLWPKKPDASETLYTLIRRLKPIVSERCGLKIVADRGDGYRLE